MHRMLPKESLNFITQKPVEFCAIWDVYGDYSLTTKRLSHAFNSGVELGETPIVFMWDIIWDRHDEWMRVLSHINLMRQDISEEKKENAIQVIIWNHDLWALMFFASSQDVRRHLENGDYRESRIKFFTEMFYGWPGEIHRQWRGMTEFLDFLPMDCPDFETFNPELVRHLFLNWPEIVKNLKYVDYGRDAVEELKKSRLCSRIGDTLFIHTPPTKKAIEFLEKWEFNFDAINEKWQSHVKNIFSSESQQKDPGSYFDIIAETFLHPDNRFSKEKEHSDYGVFSPEQALKLQAIGIKRIVFWHDWIAEGNRQTAHGIELIGVDYGMGNPHSYLQEKPKKEGVFDRVRRIIGG
jgi:hypothetical protein